MVIWASSSIKYLTACNPYCWDSMSLRLWPITFCSRIKNSDCVKIVSSYFYCHWHIQAFNSEYLLNCDIHVTGGGVARSIPYPASWWNICDVEWICVRSVGSRPRDSRRRDNGIQTWFRKNYNWRITEDKAFVNHIALHRLMSVAFNSCSTIL